MTTTSKARNDLRITRTLNRQNVGVGGVWVKGTINGLRFDALVFAEHAEVEEYEIERSRISKLWIATADASRVLYSWDRGLDRPAADAKTAKAVACLARNLADLVHGRPAAY